MARSTDAYVYLNIDFPIAAWAAVRSVLVSASAAAGNEPGFVSVASAELMRHNQARLWNELLIDTVRRLRHPHRVSRLSGMFCFLSLEDARRAGELWGLHFHLDNLVEVGFEGVSKPERLDSNWITYAPRAPDGSLSRDRLAWIDRYWSGEAYPSGRPIWETLVEGRLVIFGTEVRQQAVEVIRKAFPESLGLMEIARAAAWVGSDLGNTCAWLTRVGDDIELHWLMDMRDANNPDFIKRLDEEKAVVNQHLITPHLLQGNFGQTPDLQPYEFRRPWAEMPCLGCPANQKQKALRAVGAHRGQGVIPPSPTRSVGLA